MTPPSAVRSPLARLQPLSRYLAVLDRVLRRHGRANVLLAAAVAIPLLANAALLVGYVNATGQRSSLTRQVQEAQQKVDERLKAREAAGMATPAPGGELILPKDIESADMMDLLLKLAQESAVEIVAVGERGVATERLDSHDYRAFKYAVQVQARVSQLVAFLNRLEQAKISTLVIDKLTGTPKAGQTWLVTLDLVAYATN